MSNEFRVNTGLRQCYHPIAFHLSNVTNQQEDKHNRCSEKIMYAGDSVIVSEHRGELGWETEKGTKHQVGREIH